MKPLLSELVEDVTILKSKVLMSIQEVKPEPIPIGSHLSEQEIDIHQMISDNSVPFFQMNWLAELINTYKFAT